MSQSVKEVIEQREDLYSILGFSEVKDPKIPLSNITISDIKRRYKVMALKYHPDKYIQKNDNEPDDKETRQARFHMLSISMEILSNTYTKSQYDHWYETFRQLQSKVKDQNDNRSRLINKLNQQEGSSNRGISKKVDFLDLQKNAQQLRKLKQFNIPYGNWSGSIPIDKQDNEKEKNRKWYDSSTLRVEVERIDSNIEWSDTNKIVRLICDCLKTPYQNNIVDLYYSSRHKVINSKEQTKVLYLVFSHPKWALAVWNTWNGKNDGMKLDGFLLIKTLSPKIKMDYYLSSVKMEFLRDDVALDPNIEQILAEPEILAETIIIN